MQHARITSLVPGLVVGHIGPVCVTIWREAVDVPRFEMQVQGISEIVAKYPGRSAFVCIVEPTCRPPDDELRRRSSALVDDFDKQLACIACVIEGGGFRASVARSVLSGIALLSRAATPRSFFAEPASASRWIKQHVVIDAEDFRAAVAELRTKLAARSTSTTAKL